MARTVKEVRVKEGMVELVAKPTEKDLKTLSEILKLDMLFATGKIGVEEYLRKRARLVKKLREEAAGSSAKQQTRQKPH